VNLVTPAIIIIGAILVAIIAAPLALFSRALETSTFDVRVEGRQVVFSFTWNGDVRIKDARLTILVNGKTVGEASDNELVGGETLQVVVPASELQGNTTIVFEGSIEGIYDFRVALEAGGG